MKTIPPGPTSHVFGLDYLNRFKNEPLGTACALRDEFGDIVLLKFGPEEWLMCNHPDAVKEIFVTNWRHYGKTDRFKQLISSVDGQGLVVSEGDLWRKQRRIIQPSFNQERLVKEYAKQIVNETSQHIAQWKTGTIIDLHEEMTSITLKLAARIFFDVDASSEVKELAEAVYTISKVLFQEFSDAFPLPDWIPIPSKIEKRNAIKTLDKFIYGVIEKHKINPDSHTIVSMLLNAKDVEGDGLGMSEKQVRDEAITMFNAGHDTTAAALSWTWYLLLTHPEIYKSLLQEVDTACGGSQPDASSLHLIPLAAQCNKEAMRLYPPVWMIPRQADQDMELFGYSIKKGSMMNVSPFVIQRDARFFENPNEFIPSRFSAENEKSIYPHSFFPFGAGPRSCIGKEFALMEMPLVMVVISQQFEFELEPDSKNIGMKPIVSLEPDYPIRVRIRSRN
jgi:cytochrome P450